MKRLLTLAAVFEAVTGVAMIIEPALTAMLLLGADVSGPGAVLGRVAGIALLSFGLACWPGQNFAFRPHQAIGAMLTYNLLVACYLTFLGTGGQWVGILLWPAVVVHGLLTFLLGRAWFTTERRKDSNG